MMSQRSLALLFIGLLLLSIAGGASGQGANPFAGNGGFDSAAPRGPLGGYVGRLHVRIGDGIAGLLEKLPAEGAGVLPALLGLGILFGMVHALLPGHRQALLFSYFVSSDARPVHAVAAAGLLGFLQPLVSILLVVGGYHLLSLSLSGPIAEVDLFIRRLSAWLTLALGAVLLVLKTRELIREGRAKHEHIVERLRPVSEVLDPDGIDPTRQHLYEHSRDLSRRHRTAAQGLPWVVVSGIVPCPASALLLLFALSFGVLWAGLVSVIAVSIGIALTLSILSVAIVLLKERLMRMLRGHPGHMIHASVNALGAAGILAFGIVLVTGLW